MLVIQEVLQRFLKDRMSAVELKKRLISAGFFATSVAKYRGTRAGKRIVGNALIAGEKPRSIRLSPEKLSALKADKTKMIFKVTLKVDRRDPTFLAILPRGTAAEIAQAAVMDAVTQVNDARFFLRDKLEKAQFQRKSKERRIDTTDHQAEDTRGNELGKRATILVSLGGELLSKADEWMIANFSGPVLRQPTASAVGVFLRHGSVYEVGFISNGKEITLGESKLALMRSKYSMNHWPNIQSRINLADSLSRPMAHQCRRD